MVLDMKYDESLYIPEERSFSSIIRSGGKVKIAWNRGKKPQNPEEKKRSAICRFPKLIYVDQQKAITLSIHLYKQLSDQLKETKLILGDIKIT